MIFHDKYELLALHGGGREIALPGREISSGRDVLVHLLAAGYTPENRELLAAIDGLSADFRTRVRDMGDHEGIPFVVTEVLPPNTTLGEWVMAAKSAVSAPLPIAGPGRSGEWKIPEETEPTRRTVSSSAEPGELPRLFQAVKAPEPVRQSRPSQDDLPTAAIAVPKLDPPAPVEAEAGEFTRMLRSAAPAPSAAPAAPPAPSAGEVEAGEFTRMLRSAAPAPAAAPAAPPAPSAAEAEAGEFTRMLRSAAPAPAAAPAAPPAPSAAGPEAGEFTRMLRSAAPAPAATPAAPPAPSAAEAEAGDFTRMLRTAGPSPAAAPRAPAEAVPQLSEFTRVRRSAVPRPLPATAAPETPAAGTQPPIPQQAEPGEFTRMFQVQTPVTPGTAKMASPLSPPPPQAQPSAPGEFTRMMQSPLAPEPVRSKPAAPPAPSSSEFTRMMQAGKFNDAPPLQGPLPGGSGTPPASRTLQPPGEFTRMFNTEAADKLTTPPAPRGPLPRGGLATGAFSRQASTAPPPISSGPSEFTQMFSAPAPAPPTLAPVPKPVAAAPKAQKSHLTLVLILAGLFLLVVVLILIFALTR